jgi:thiamine transporter ThiT
MAAPSAPKKITWIIGLVAGILGIIGHFAHIQVLTEYNYPLLLIGFAALAIGTTFKEL